MSVLFGVDLSNYQRGISLAGIARERFTFVLCKVSQGSTYRSPDWPRQRDEARAAGLVLAGYHYIDESAPDAQAANCLAALGDPSIPVALDCEKGSGSLDNFRRVLDAFRRAGIRVALSYIPRWYWQELGSPDLSDLPPLWASRYPSTEQSPAPALYRYVEQAGGTLSKYWQGYGGNHVAILQFASTAIVQGRPVDADAFDGTRDELLALLGAGSTAGVSLAKEEDVPTAREIADAILDTPIPRYGDHIDPGLVGGTTSLRNEIGWLTNSFTNGPWWSPGPGAQIARQVDALAAAGSSMPDELRALRDVLDRLDARLGAAAGSDAGGALADPAAALRSVLADIRVAFPTTKESTP